MAEQKQQWFGIAVQEDGSVTVSKGRATEAAAVSLSEKTSGVRHFGVQAANGSEARKKGLELALSAEMSGGGGLVEPTAAELAEAANRAVSAAQVESLRWFAAGLDEKGDSVVGSGDFRTPDEAMSAEVEGRVDGTAMAIQAASAEQAKEIVDAQGGTVPKGPVYRAPAPAGPRGPVVRVYGTKPRKAQVYYVTGPGTVHVDKECRFVTRAAQIKGGVVEFRTTKPVVSLIKDEEQTLDIPDTSRKARDWCRFCSVEPPTEAEREAARAEALKAQEKAAKAS